MAKKTKTTKAKPSATSKPARKGTRAPAPPATTEAQDAQAAAPAREDAATAAAPRERVRDSRLPPPGTVIEKRDRAGKVRCACTVEEGGVRYKETLYKSLSGAALAAAKDLGLTNRSANGWVFWGITKVARPAGDGLVALSRAWDRYRERAAGLVAAVKDDDRVRVREVFDEHAEALKDLREKIA
jgi:hypothetical protein